MAILPSKLQLYLSHVRSPGHFIRSKRSKWINEIRKCDINIVNDLIVTHMIILCSKMTSAVLHQSWLWRPRSDRSELHAVMDLETFLDDDDKMTEWPVCDASPGWWLVTVNTEDHQRPDTHTGDTWHTAHGTNIIYVLVTRAGFTQQPATAPVFIRVLVLPGCT